MALITYQDIKNNEHVNNYIICADHMLTKLGYTEHSFAHVTKVANAASQLLLDLGYDSRTAELAAIAGHMHDIGNVINRIDHAQSGAVMAFTILERMGMPAGEIASIITAIGNHDEGTSSPLSSVSAALIIADKTDVRRSRVRGKDKTQFDIHDRVNYAAEECKCELDKELRTFTLSLKIDTTICAVMDYFEIFLTRMLLCRRAAEYLDIQFKLVVNGQILL